MTIRLHLIKLFQNENQYFAVASVLRTRSRYQGLSLKFVEARISLELFTSETNPLSTRHITKWA